MRRFLHAARPVWRVAVLVSLLAWLVGASAPAQAQELDWATSAGGRDVDGGTSIAVDGMGNSYVTGYFSKGKATFGANESHKTVLKTLQRYYSADHLGEMFVAKYDRRGHLVWVTATRVDDVVVDELRNAIGDTRLAVDGVGNSYVAGRFNGTVTFGPGEAHETTLSAAWPSSFLATYDRNGRLRWARQIGGSSFLNPIDIAVDGAGNSYVTGNHRDSHRYDIFVAKYDDDGRLLWTRSAGGPYSERGRGFTPGNGISNGITVDGAGNSYITGYFIDTMTFSLGETQETTITTVDNTLFVATYDGDGRLRWVRQADGEGGKAVGRDVAVDEAGNSFVLGTFSGTVTFGVGDAQDTTLTHPALAYFVATYDGDGRLRWVRQAGGDVTTQYRYHITGSETAQDRETIAVDRAGDISVIGDFIGSPTFGAGEANETTLHTAAYGWDVFILKYDASGALRWARQTGDGTGQKILGGAAVDSAGHSYLTGSFLSPTATFGDDDTSHITLVGDAKPGGFIRGEIFVAKFLGGSGGELPEEPRRESPVVVLANTAVTLDRPGPSEGAIWSNGTLRFRPSPANSPSVFTGELTAVHTITIDPGNTITGTATAGWLVAVLPGATVTGEVMDNMPVPPVPLPAPTFTAAGPDHTVPPGGTLALAPGSYGAVTVSKWGTLQLQSGDYFLRTLLLGKEADLVVDVTSGPVRLHVVERLDIGKGVQVTLLPADADSALLHINTIQTTPLAIRAEAQVVGTLLAPHAAVTVGGLSQFTGALIADKVTVQPGAMLQPHGASSLP